MSVLTSAYNAARNAFRRFWSPETAEELRSGPAFGSTERLVTRILFALVIYWEIYLALPAQVMSISGQPVPVGIAHFLDLTFFADRELLGKLGFLLVPALILYAVGIGLPIVMPVIWFLVIGPTTLAQSQGANTHHLQAAALVLTAQTVWSIIWGIRRLMPNFANTERQQDQFYRQLMWISIQVLVATYLTTGITKMWDSDFQWVKNAKNFPIQLEKTRMSEYYNRLELPGTAPIDGPWWKSVPEHTDAVFAKLSRRIEAFLIESPTWSRIFMASGLLLEFAAVLALLGRRWALVIGLTLIAFHLSISRVMSLDFFLTIQILAIFLVNPAYWIRWLIAKKR
tara:strand:- start:307 stop:1329 length:1023 start_codon:yes stop_codon:yes gene_type:complete